MLAPMSRKEARTLYALCCIEMEARAALLGAESSITREQRETLIELSTVAADFINRPSDQAEPQAFLAACITELKDCLSAEPVSGAGGGAAAGSEQITVTITDPIIEPFVGKLEQLQTSLPTAPPPSVSVVATQRPATPEAGFNGAAMIAETPARRDSRTTRDTEELPTPARSAFVMLTAAGGAGRPDEPPIQQRRALLLRELMHTVLSLLYFIQNIRIPLSLETEISADDAEVITRFNQSTSQLTAGIFKYLTDHPRREGLATLEQFIDELSSIPDDPDALNTLYEHYRAVVASPRDCLVIAGLKIHLNDIAIPAAPESVYVAHSQACQGLLAAASQPRVEGTTTEQPGDISLFQNHLALLQYFRDKSPREKHAIIARYQAVIDAPHDENAIKTLATWLEDEAASATSLLGVERHRRICWDLIYTQAPFRYKVRHLRYLAIELPDLIPPDCPLNTQAIRDITAKAEELIAYYEALTFLFAHRQQTETAVMRRYEQLQNQETLTEALVGILSLQTVYNAIKALHPEATTIADNFLATLQLLGINTEGGTDLSKEITGVPLPKVSQLMAIDGLLSLVRNAGLIQSDELDAPDHTRHITASDALVKAIRIKLNSLSPFPTRDARSDYYSTLSAEQIATLLAMVTVEQRHPFPLYANLHRTITGVSDDDSNASNVNGTPNPLATAIAGATSGEANTGYSWCCCA